MRSKTQLAALLLLFLSASALAQRPVSVGIPTARFNFVAVAQLHTDWCWAASVQMVLNWYNIPVTQTEVVDRIYGKPVDSAASENQIAVALTGYAFDRRGHKVNLHTVRYRGAPSTALLVEQLGHRRPMLITFRSTKTMLHAVVLTGAEYVQDKNGLRLTALTVRDPSPTFRDRHSADTLHLTGTELAQFEKAISSYYVLSIHA